MVEYECVIYQRVNYVLNHSYFRRNTHSARLNVQIMSKADNYNEHDYDQISGEKYTKQRQYTIRGLDRVKDMTLGG